MSVDPRSTNAIDLSEQLSDILEEYKDVLSRVNDRVSDTTGDVCLQNG